MLLQDVCSNFIPMKKGEQAFCGSVYWLAYKISHSYKVWIRNRVWNLGKGCDGNKDRRAKAWLQTIWGLKAHTNMPPFKCLQMSSTLFFLICVAILNSIYQTQSLILSGKKIKVVRRLGLTCCWNHLMQNKALKEKNWPPFLLVWNSEILNKIEYSVPPFDSLFFPDLETVESFSYMRHFIVQWWNFWHWKHL